MTFLPSPDALDVLRFLSMLEEELVKDSSPMWDMEFVPPANTRPITDCKR